MDVWRNRSDAWDREMFPKEMEQSYQRAEDEDPVEHESLPRNPMYLQQISHSQHYWHLG